MGILTLKNGNNSLIPQYYLHFTIAKIQDGIAKTLGFEEGQKVTDFPGTLSIETGQYVLVTGKRLSNGSVLSSLTFFNIIKDQPTNVEVILRKEDTDLRLLGRLDLAGIHLSDITNNTILTLADLMKNRNAVIVLLDPDSEPSKHILNDLGPFISQFDLWDGRFIFINIKEKGDRSEVFQNYKLPAKTSFALDTKNEFEEKLTLITIKEAGNNLPAVVFCLPGGEVLMIATGYRIGMGESLLQIIKNIEENPEQLTKSSCTTP
jgi:hypothetical protein